MSDKFSLCMVIPFSQIFDLITTKYYQYLNLENMDTTNLVNDLILLLKK